jgi:PIN domain nuclease of toxin-antitoxin system
LGNLLLDTCGLIWLAQGGGKLSKSTISAIDEAQIVYVSSISAWEISQLHSMQKLDLPSEPLQWFADFIQSQNILELPLNSEAAIKSSNLPWHHKDPADRFIIATAIIKNLSIVTGDKKFPKYDVHVLA